MSQYITEIIPRLLNNKTTRELNTYVNYNKHFICYDCIEYYLLDELETFDTIEHSINTALSIKLGIKPTIIDIKSYEPQFQLSYNEDYEYENNGMIDSMVKYINESNNEILLTKKIILILPMLKCFSPWIIQHKYSTSHNNMSYGMYFKQLMTIDFFISRIMINNTYCGNLIIKSFKIKNGFKYGFINTDDNILYPGITLHYNSGHTYDIPEHQCYVVKNNNKKVYFFTCDPINIPFSEILKFDIISKPSILYITDEFVDTNGKNIISINDNTITYNTYIEGVKTVKIPCSFINVPYTNMDVCEVSTDGNYGIELYL